MGHGLHEGLDSCRYGLWLQSRVSGHRCPVLPLASRIQPAAMALQFNSNMEAHGNCYNTALCMLSCAHIIACLAQPSRGPLFAKQSLSMMYTACSHAAHEPFSSHLQTRNRCCVASLCLSRAQAAQMLSYSQSPEHQQASASEGSSSVAFGVNAGCPRSWRPGMVPCCSHDNIPGCLSAPVVS